MSHAQAYHTSCREGLAGQPGFQFNAATPALTRDSLQALAAAHAGYHVARDAPLEPTAAELASFPVALKHLPVEGIGPVISRTAYVGREFRGHDGEPDSGRFGNYFSHIVVGDGAAEPFDGLLPIELWDAPHWRAAEARGGQLPELERLAPGAVDLEAALAALGPRRAWLGRVLHAVLDALADERRVVLVEPDPALGVAWVAWVSFALPPELARGLTFSTYEGQPRYADGLQLCVTTPGCDIGFAPYELGRSVELIEPANGPPGEPAGLYPRVLAALADTGAEAVASMVRALPPGLGEERLGAWVAAVTGRCDLAATAEAPPVLDALTQLVAAGDVAAAAVAAVPDAADVEAARAWARLHAAARSSAAEDARAIVDEALRRLLAWPERLPAELATVPAGAPTTPSVGVLATWMDRLESERGRLGEVIQLGRTLGLVGCNAALDRRLAGVIAEGLTDPPVRSAFEDLAADPSHRDLLAAVAVALVDRCAVRPEAFGLVSELAVRTEFAQAIHAYAGESDAFAVRAVWERLAVQRAPARLPKSLAVLIPMAEDDAAHATIRILFGPDGPASPDEHAALLDAYVAAARSAPGHDLERAYAFLEGTPLQRRRELAPLARALSAWPGMNGRPAYIAWYAAKHQPADPAEIVKWSGWIRRAVVTPPPLRRDRLTDLLTLAAAKSARWAGMRYPDFDEAVGVLASTFGEDWRPALATALEQRLEGEERPERLVAAIFHEWSNAAPRTASLLDSVLPDALRRFSAGRLEEVGECLPSERSRERWSSWVEMHPAQGGLGRAVGRLFKRDGS